MSGKDAAELKAQGVAEAARDPSSGVTSEDAERKLKQEASKAGAEVFSFDPNATPEQKAAQARAARSKPGAFSSELKPKGVSVVTDIDDGTPSQYDLPAPAKPSDIPITPVDKKANGVVKDNARWEERSGWAPRFGDGPTPPEGDDRIDHQTWVEGKLDDKFFGDWYHNTGIIIFACLSSWLVAVLGGGLAWVFIIMATCGTYYRTSIRRVRRNFRDDVSREMAKNKLETDSESLEWINSFLVKFWPIIQPVISETVINSVDQVLSTTTPAFLDSLRMKTFVLGTKPPRLEHVKTYPRVEDDVVIMDWKFSFTPSDVLDLTQRQMKSRINPKVVLEIRIGKAMISKGLDVIVEDFAFSGLMRVKVKLQLAYPHVDRIDVCFLERPEIDYVCKPLGGDTFGFDINFIPGLETFIQEQIHANIGPIMYDPNVFPIEVAKMLAGTPVDQAVGIVAITLHGAQGLKNPDKFSGTPDPYVKVLLDNRTELARTKIIQENANPKWNETKYIIVTSLKDSINLQIYDYNEIRKDKELGIATFPLERCENDAEHENEQIEVMANGKARGNITADIRFFPILEGQKLEDGTEEPPPESNTGIARFTVEQAKELDGSKFIGGSLNPYAVLLLNGKEIHITKKLKRTNNPIWSDGSKEIMITDRKSAKLGLVIKDDTGLTKDPELGTYQIKLNDMLTVMEKGQEWYPLAGATSGRVKMTLQWKPVGLKGIVGGTGGYITPIGVMRLHFINARNLRNLETLGKSDPYVRVLLSGVEKAKTVTFQNDLNPNFDEVIYIPMRSTREKLVLEVMDYENLGKDRSLGMVELAAEDYIFKDENGGFKVNGERKPEAGELKMHGKGASKGLLNYTCSFYPTMNVIDPEEEEEEKKAAEEAKKAQDEEEKPDTEKTAVEKENEKKESGKVSLDLQKKLEDGEEKGVAENELLANEVKVPKIRVTPDNLSQYECGLIVFKLLEAELAHSNVFIEVLMDDMLFPSYTSSKIRSRSVKLEETGDTVVRELDLSKITLRLKEKTDHKGGDKEDHTIAKLVGETLQTLKQSLYNPTVLTLKDSDGGINKVKVMLKYIPIEMTLDASESINNMGNLRIDVLDAADLPAADRSGYSDPYCKFILNGKDVYKTKVQKKTLHPAWNEYFEVPVPSRTGANFVVKVYDWDLGDKPDFLGEADINLDLLDPFVAKEVKYKLDGKSGTLRLRMVFKPDYVTRSRQGSSTFSGTFAPAGKIVTGVAGAPVKGVGIVGGGVVKGASFIRHGFSRKKKENGSLEPEAVANSDGLNGSLDPSPAPPRTPDPSASPAHIRNKSFGAQSIISMSPAGADSGTANIIVLGTSGYPASANVRVHIKQVTSKGAKDIYKTKAIKASSGDVRWDSETAKISCTADTQFQVQVKDHATIGFDDELGEGLFVLDDSNSGAEKEIKAGPGSVMIRTSFVAADAQSIRDSPRGGQRRSFLSKRDPRERGTTPS
ncbi:MAG: hypothetical protein M1814_002990 [Vezdaea aestivalis]|nr:MAG: hypothetical protein M1814_002990 [Vezdaea aestivalis]